MCLVSKRADCLPNPIRSIHSKLMEMPMTPGFAPQRNQVRFDCPIFKKRGNFKSEALRLFDGVEATENQTIKTGVAWQIKRLVREYDNIFYEFQFVHPHQTCLSAIILKQITVNSFVLTKTPGIIIDNDATGAFDRVINSIALIALHSLGLSLVIIRMLGLTWRTRKCYIKTGFGISQQHYQSTLSKQNFGLGQGSTAASNMWCVIRGVLMNAFAFAYTGFVMASVSSKVVHKRIGEGHIDDTGLVVSAQASTEITSSRVKRFSSNEAALFVCMNRMIKFFLELLQVAGGDLNISKCACFTVFHRWKGGRATLLRTHDSHPPMTITHPSTGEVKRITRKNPNEAHRDLGWMMTTDGKSTAQFIVSKAKAKLFAGGIRQSRMQRYDATNTYNV
jgi:hypothetical protein